MNKTITAALIFLLCGTIAYAWTNDGQYHMECLHKGDKLPNGYVCGHTLCLVCQKSGYMYPAVPYCNGLAAKCGGTVDNGTLDKQPPTITLSSPQNGQSFGKRTVTFSIQVNEPSNIYYMNNNDQQRGYINLCSKCTSYQRDLSFDDGFRNVTVMAQDLNGNKGYKTVTFTVDSKPPVIKSTLPKEKSYSNGQFSVLYDEANLKKVTLHWKQAGGSYNDLIKTNCPTGLKQTCNYTVAGLPQGQLFYYFTIQDAVTPVSSKEVGILVDTITPVLTRMNPQNTPYADKKIPFKYQISEPVTLEYKDFGDSHPAYKPLCKNCMTYDKAVTLNDGQHQVVVRATDPAGNKANDTITFWIDSIDPKIKDMLPNDKSYANGTFSIDVEELNLNEVKLHYKENGKDWATMTEHAGDCTNMGKNVYRCIFKAPLTMQGALQYYFEATDLATSVNSKTFNEIVDTIKPTIVINKLATKNINDKNLMMNISISEPVTLTYQDLGMARSTQLCTKCTKYVGSKSFNYGHHELTIGATDPAGNHNEVTKVFEIKDPRIP